MKRLLLTAALMLSLSGMPVGMAYAVDNLIPEETATGGISADMPVEHGGQVEHDALEGTISGDVEHLDIHAAEGHHGAAGEEHHGGGGLPQLNPKWFASQIFWLVLTFSGLYLLFSRSVLPALSNTLENRHEHVQGDLDTAQRLKTEAEKVHQAYETSLENARTQATRLYQDVEEDIKVKAEKQQADLQDRLKKETELSEARIEKSKNEAMKEMNTIAAEIASEAAKKIVGISTDINSARSVVESLTNSKAKKAA